MVALMRVFVRDACRIAGTCAEERKHEVSVMKSPTSFVALYSMRYAHHFVMNARWPYLQWGSRPPNRPLSPRALLVLGCVGLDSSFDK